MKPLSRQRLWQKQRQRQGVCILCPDKAVKGQYCAKHNEYHRTAARNRYRKAHGIALDAPIRTRSLLPPQVTAVAMLKEIKI